MDVTADPTDLRAIRAAGIAGLVFAVTLTTSLVLLRIDPVVLSSVDDDGVVQVSDATLVALYLIPFSGIAFAWFIAALRRRIGRLEDQLFATVFLASGLLFIAMLFASGAAASAAVAASRFGAQPAAGSVAFVFGASLAKTLFYAFAVKMAGAFMLVSSTIGRRTGAFPRWFVLVGMVAGLVMLFSVGFFEPLALIFPAWVAGVSVLLLRAHPDSWREG